MQARVSHKTRAYSRRKEKKTMLSTIEAINNAVNNFIWGVPAMICIIGVGLVLSFRTRFLQIRKFPYAMKVTFGRMFKKREASDGAMTPFQAVCTALAATVGTGNIAGVAGAIAIGGLDVDFRNSRYVYEVFGSDACGAFPGEKCAWGSGRRPNVLY